MKYNIKKIVLLMTVTISVLLFSQKVYASDGTISISSTASTIGNEVSVSVTVSGSVEVGTVDLWLTYDPAIIEAVSGFDGGGGGRIHILSSDNTNFTLKFKTVGVGETSVSVDSSMTYVYNYNPEDGDYMNYSVSAGKVSVNAPKTYSTNNNLKSLTVSPGQLTPEFKTDVLEYTMTVSEDCERLNVSAETADDKATVSVSGTLMDYGDNQTYIKVTAENGDVKTYIIYTKREGEPPTEEPEVKVSVTINGENYNVDSDYEAHPLPEGFEIVEYTYKGQNVHIGKGISKKLYIFYLQKGEGEEATGGYYIYNEEKDLFYKMINLSQAQGIYTIVEFENGEVDIPAGYEETDEMIDGILRKVYVGEDKDSFLIYLMNYNGDTNWYRYDRSENTIQRYFEATIVDKEEVKDEEEVTEENKDNTNEEELKKAYEEIEELKKTNEESLKKMFVIILILSAIIIVTMFAIIAYAIKLKSKKEDANVVNDLDDNEETTNIKSDKEDNKEDIDNKKDTDSSAENSEYVSNKENVEVTEESMSNKSDTKTTEDNTSNTEEIYDSKDHDNNEKDTNQEEFEFVDSTKVEEGIIGQDEEMLGDSISEMIENTSNKENDTISEDKDKNSLIDDNTTFISLEKLEDTQILDKEQDNLDNTKLLANVQADVDEESTTIDEEIIKSMKQLEEKQEAEWSEYDLYEDEEDDDTKVVINEDGETVRIKDGVEVTDDMFIDLDDN